MNRSVQQSRSNNFDFLRLIFALFVLLSHSYPLSGLEENADWSYRITNAQLTWSNLGVYGFFIISGFLIYQSLDRSKTVVHFFWKRLLRLFPGLFVVLTLTVLLAPFVYENQKTNYLFNQSVWSYIPNNLSLYNLQVSINGVFEHNPFKSSIINGSLWTIPYEFTLYMAIALLYFVENKKLRIYILSSTFMLLLVSNIFYVPFFKQIHFLCLNGNQFTNLGCFFIAGSLLASIHFENISHKNHVLFLSIIVCVLAISASVFNYVGVIILPITIVLFATKSTPLLNTIGDKIGDLSYGVYIYGFVVQQTIEYYYKLNYWQLMVSSIIVSLFLAYFSWHIVEKRALYYKKMFE